MVQVGAQARGNALSVDLPAHNGGPEAQVLAFRYRARPSSDVIRRVDSELRVIDEDTWNQTKQRLEKVRAAYTRTGDGQPKGRAVGATTSYPFSGLLRCALCETPMTIYGGSAQKYYRCGDCKKRGTCTNGLSLREDVARACLLRLLRRARGGRQPRKSS